MPHDFLAFAPASARGATLDWPDAVTPWAWPATGAPPDLCIACARDGTAEARGSLWWTGTPRYRGAATVLLGDLAAMSPPAMISLLREVVSFRSGTLRWIVAPIDGSTWHRYRVTVGGGAPLFAMEPANPAWWADAFASAGLDVVERYWSATRDLATDPVARATPPAPDEVWRPIDRDRLDEDLGATFDLAVQAFAANPLYTPIGRGDFVRLYAPVLARLDPAWSLIVEREGAPIGLMLAIPERDALVLKTIAVAESERGRGLGTRLLEEMARRGQERGFRRVIYALMHEEGPSSRIVRRLATPGRAYHLYGKSVP